MGSHITDEPSQRILDDVRRVVQNLRESTRTVEGRYGITGAQLFVLRRLREGGPLTVNELAAKTLTHQSSVSVVVKRLELAGFVKRATSPHDGRRVTVSLTARGRRLASKAPDPAQRRLLDAVRKLPARDQERLADLLDQVVEAMGLQSPLPPPMFFEKSQP